nr:hypothetical protein [Tanacetum cinerariifolium]
MANLEFCDTHNMVAYLQKPEEFWQTATTRTLDNREMEITVTIDGKVKVVTEASVRRHLKLEDSECISILPTTEIFDQLALIDSNITTALICLATNRTFNFSKMIFDGMVKNLDRPNFLDEGLIVSVESYHTPTGAPSTSPPYLSSPPRSFIRQENKVPHPSSPTHTHVADEAASTGVDVRHGGAATTVASLDAGQGSDRVLALEEDLKQTKKVYGAAYTKLIMKVSTHGEAHSQEDQPEDQLGVLSAAKVLTDTAKRNVQTYTRRRAISTGSGGVSTTSRMISTAEESVSTAGASMPVSTAGMIDKSKEERNKYSEVDQAMMLVDLINQRKIYFAEQKAEAKRKKPMTQAQQRIYMSNYIKHMGSYTLKQLKKLSFDEIKELFEATMRTIKDFVSIESEDDKAVLKLAEARSSKRDAGEELDQGRSKKQKIGESSEPRNKDVDELSQKELQ